MEQQQHPMMKCGCAAQGVLIAKGEIKFDPPIPACITHSCYEVADKAPDLSGRMSECSYLPRGHDVKPSDPERLAFFEYRGPGSPAAEDTCKCGMFRSAHWPRWRAEIKYARHWYKIERSEGVRNEETHLPDEEAAKLWGEEMRERWLNWTNDPQTKVFEAELISVKRIPSNIKCKQFVSHGPHERDHHYCGCHGWD